MKKGASEMSLADKVSDAHRRDRELAIAKRRAAAASRAIKSAERMQPRPPSRPPASTQSPRDQSLRFNREARRVSQTALGQGVGVVAVVLAIVGALVATGGVEARTYLTVVSLAVAGFSGLIVAYVWARSRTALDEMASGHPGVVRQALRTSESERQFQEAVIAGLEEIAASAADPTEAAEAVDVVESLLADGGNRGVLLNGVVTWVNDSYAAEAESRGGRLATSAREEGRVSGPAPTQS